MAIKKSELYSSLWASCDELRGGMDASQYKDYVLVMLFVKYVSDKYAGQRRALIEVPAGGGFADMVALKGKVDIGEQMNKIISKLAEANELKGIIDQVDFNDKDKLGKGKEMQDRLSNLVAIFENPALDFSKNRAEGDDLLGDAYEYLMRNFATQSGKSKGQFYTPAEVSRVMAKVIGVGSARSADTTIHDPTCGSGSLLIKAADEAVAASGVKISIYGQEKDNATRALALMNMILHNHPTAEIVQGNTLADPLFTTPNGTLKTFDFVVANPPFSDKAWSNGVNIQHDPHERFAEGVPPAKNGDYAFLLHILRVMKSSGKGAVILPHGVLFRGNAESAIRKNIVRKGYIKGIIGLPANLFFGTGIPACIIVLDKENAAARAGIFMIDASQGYLKDGNKNRLRHQDIHKIVDVFNRQLEVPRYSRLVPLAEIEANDYNLNLPRYIDSSQPEDIQDITAHLCGGIPNRDLDALEPYWQAFPGLRADLFAPGERPGYSQPKVEAAQVRATILGHPEFAAYKAAVTARFDGWAAGARALLLDIGPDCKPKALMEQLAENLLAAFSETEGNSHLIDPYALYQRFMDYWSEVMQDDVYLITDAGWQGAAQLRQIGEDRKSKEKPDLEIGRLKLKADLIPPALLVACYFAAEQRALDGLKAEAERLEQQLEELREEHGGEEGLLAEAVDEKGSLTRGGLTKRLKEIQGDREAGDECQMLETYAALLEQQAEANWQVKDAQKALDEQLVNQYGRLSEAEVKALVVDAKWLAVLRGEVTGEIERVSQALTGRIKELTERYAAPLAQIMSETVELNAKIKAHLHKMGLVWY